MNELGEDGEKMFRRGVGIMAAFMLVSLLPVRTAGQDPCSTEQTPTGVRTLLKQKFPGWALVTLLDLRLDDQKIWKKTNPNMCPGYVAGNFQSIDRLSYAFNLFRKDHGKFFEVLLVIDPEGEDYRLHVLSKPQEAAILGVVTRHPPGVYTDSYETRRIKAEFNVISYEQLEAGQLVYYWVNGRYHSILTSD
jgi:hypothetical protein